MVGAGGAIVAVEDKLAAEAMPPEERIEERQSFVEAREEVIRLRAGESSLPPAPPCPVEEVEVDGLPPMKPRKAALFLIPPTAVAELDEEAPEEVPPLELAPLPASPAFPAAVEDSDGPGVALSGAAIPVSQSLSPPSNAPVMIRFGAASG